jgi:antitoxin component HigA of HigAB toxin-antitoxin module
MAGDAEEKLKQFLCDRARAYQTLFPDGVATVAVLADLAQFCRAKDSTFHSDSRVSAQLDGRREVYLRIMDHLSLTQDELWLKYGLGIKKGIDQ